MQTGRQCPDGWDFVENGQGGKCMNFYLGGESHLPWYDGFHYCQSIGARMMMIENDLEQKFVSQDRRLVISGVSMLETVDVGDLFAVRNSFLMT